MLKRRNLTEREIVEREEVDLSYLNTTRSGSAVGVIQSPADGGSTGGAIGVPTNLVVVAQEVVDFDGEYRVNVIVEFDGVAGAQEYEARILEG